MKKNPTVKEIVKKFLKENGYHGLYGSDCCSCDVKDLMPGCESVGSCVAGHKIKCKSWA